MILMGKRGWRLRSTSSGKCGVPGEILDKPVLAEKAMKAALGSLIEVVFMRC